MSFLQYLSSNNIVSSDIISILDKNDWYESILEMTDLSEDFIAKLQAKYYNLKYISLEDDFVKLENFDYSKLESLYAIPYYVDSELYIAVYDPSNLDIKDKINYYLSLDNTFSNMNVKYSIATKSDIINKFNDINYKDINHNDISRNEIDFISDMIQNALKLRASDIHISPFSKMFVIMFRVDGEMLEYKTLPIKEYSALAISLKVKSKLDIAETRRPQSGQFCLNKTDFRLSTHPTIYGENIVIRILNKSNKFINIEKLGFSSNDVNYLKTISKLAQGIIIFCGPTGSGKTTSIYALIEQMNKKARNIMTLEDPIEYEIFNVKQTEIKTGILDFAIGIRSLLRQDPDVILIGEIRDEETAQMAIRASMTGHLVLTTIHANNSLGAISRLVNFGISSQFIAENIITIISQRLVKFKEKPGRTIIYEILKSNTKLKHLISQNSSEYEILNYLQDVMKFETIKQNALKKAKEGLISYKEIEEKYGII